ncbi:MAG: AAA family ATPase [Halioglobus sp.]|nr:AAA family ATPase [Halioglobus sp.]
MLQDLSQLPDAGTVLHATPGAAVDRFCCGLSGSGKTTLGRHIAAELDAVHLRSDVERKRLFGLGMQESSAASGLDIYTSDASRRTFDRLLRTGRRGAGPRRRGGGRRDVYRGVTARAVYGAGAAATRATGTSFTARSTAYEAHRRLAARRGDASEAGIAQYEEQRRRFEKFSTAEAARVVALDTARKDALQKALQTLRCAVRATGCADIRRRTPCPRRCAEEPTSR